jgi:hypothetical protein
MLHERVRIEDLRAGVDVQTREVQRRLVAGRLEQEGTWSSSMPKRLLRPPMRIREPLSSCARFTRKATRTRLPRRRAAAAMLAASPSASTWKQPSPASTAASISVSVLPGPAKRRSEAA